MCCFDPPAVRSGERYLHGNGRFTLPPGSRRPRAIAASKAAYYVARPRAPLPAVDAPPSKCDNPESRWDDERLPCGGVGSIRAGWLSRPSRSLAQARAGPKKRAFLEIANKSTLY